MNRIPFLALALALFLAPVAARAQTQAPAKARPAAAAPAGAAVDPISTYLRQDTQLVVVLDLNQIDLDQLITYMTAKAKEAKVAQADLDKQMAQAKPQIDQAKGVLNQFRQAGASRVYALINVQGAMAGEFGTVFIPTNSPDSAKQVAELVTGMVNPGNAADGPAKVTTAGTVALIQSKQAAAQPPAAPVGPGSGNPTLLSAIRARAAAPAAALSIMVDGKAFAQVAAQTGAQGEDKAMIEGTDWMALSANLPPQPSFNLTVQAKDAATAQKMAARAAAEMDKGRNDPEAKRVLGDTTAVYKTLKPVVQGNTVTVDLDTTEIEQVVAPAFAKAAAEAQKQQQGQPPTNE